jgi:hypothetical protein
MHKYVRLMGSSQLVNSDQRSLIGLGTFLYSKLNAHKQILQEQLNFDCMTKVHSFSLRRFVSCVLPWPRA